MSLAHNSALHSIKVTLVGARPGGSDIQKKLREKDNDCCANDANRDSHRQSLSNVLLNRFLVF